MGALTRAGGSVLIAVVLTGSAMAVARPPKVAPAPAAAPAPLTPAQSIRAGVEKWRAGAYPEAVALWLPFAAAGDPDAMFNMGQAYKLGRGVAPDPMIARDYYRKAAAKGHLPAQANLGISLFQTGEKPEAVRWLRQAADRGEARAQYVLGIAAFNGDGLPRAAGLGYGYLLRSAASGLPQATAALSTIEPGLSPADRATGEAVAASLVSGKGVPVALAMATGPRLITAPPPPGTTQLHAPPPIAPPPLIKAPPPPSVPLSVTPVVGALKPNVVISERLPARALAPVSVQKPSSGPLGEAGAKLADASAQLAAAGSKLAAALTPTALSNPMASAAPQPTGITPPAANLGTKAAPQNVVLKAFTTVTDSTTVKRTDTWRVQLGAFSQRQLADAAWAQLPKAELGAVKPIFASDGPVTKLQLGPYASREAARSACAKLSTAGRACFVTAG